MAKERYEGLISGLYNRNEIFFMLSAMMFIASIFIGYAFAGMLEPILAEMLGDFKRRLVQGELQLTTLSLFANNIKIALLLYGGGLIFGVITAFYLISNGIFIGYTAAQFQLGDFIIYTLPHGVFELLGIIIAGAAGFKLASIELKILKGVLKLQSDFSMSNQLKYLLEANWDEFKDTLVLMGIAAVLILIGAIIEANFTISWASYIKGVA
ncbi:stage II sporulation protein M [Methanobacterium sp.]|uniref:stage II sporulation protein M n=1 Tax=Methanobacterium sp. TaxID=2164 RepID=UPI0025D26E0B|nr:stage II sporulation protein M [Methanobacterium sp.]MBI5458281.1 stage II sporulation protein M [Methanobacterium sp.]